MFDVFVMVDWSASSVPTRGADSIWFAALDAATGELRLENPPTRHRAEAAIRELLLGAAGRRVLVGVDVPFGYPVGFAACLPPVAAGAPPWRTVWRTITAGLHDAADNRNDRFELAARLNAHVGEGPGPFWGCPPSRASATLASRKVHRFPVSGPAGPIEELRLTEQRCRRSGRRPLSVWQTAYVGSVGSQALTAIPVLERLVGDPALGGRVEVWPFTTGLTPDPTAGGADAVVLAEIWPSGFDLDLGRHAVKDAAQVIGTCEHLAALAAAGALPQLFAPELDEAERAAVMTEEAWILGVR